jgi:S-methylmethionine-dependent homocysteine/selenocysteine methylase
MHLASPGLIIFSTDQSATQAPDYTSDMHIAYLQMGGSGINTHTYYQGDPIHIRILLDMLEYEISSDEI